MRNKLKLVFGVILFSISVSSALAVGDGLLTPAYVLSEVAKSSATIKCFSAEVHQSSLAVSSSTNPSPASFYFQTNCPDGRIEFRAEVVKVNKLGQTNSSVAIRNSDGMWFLVNGKAIKMEFFGVEMAAVNQSLASMPLPDKNKMEATITETNFNGIPCYLLTESMDNTSADSIGDVIKNIAKVSSADLDKVFPVKRQYYIGTNDFFIYSTCSYNKNNLKISEITFTDVKKNPPLPPNTFVVPNGTPIIIAHSLKEYVDSLVAVYVGNSNALISKPPSLAARYTVLIFAIGSALFTIFVLYKDTVSRKPRQD